MSTATATDSTPRLTPAGCDLRDFAFMPLHVMRLRRSKAWLKAKRKPELAFFMLNLWTASWHEVPAGSLEDDDDTLADLAMCDPAKWSKVRAEVLHGWISGPDGRLYHPTVCEAALTAWDAKLDQRWRTECARIKKHADRHKIKLPRPTFDEWVEQGCPTGQRLPVPRDTDGTEVGQGGETRSKGEGEGQREGEGEGQGQGQGDSYSVGAKAPTGADAPPPPAPPPAAQDANPLEKPAKLTQEQGAALTKQELWRVGKALLVSEGLPEAAAASYVGKLVRDYTDEVVIEVLREAVVQQPADLRSWLVAACQRRRGAGRRAPMTGAQQLAESQAKGARLQAAMEAAGGAVAPATTLAATRAPGERATTALEAP